MLTRRIEQQLAPTASTPDISGCRNVEHHVLDAQQQLEERNCTPEAKVEERTDELLLERDNLKGILDAMNNGVYIVNQQLEIEYANPALLQEFGPVGGRTCHSYLHGRQSICPQCRNPEVFSGRTIHREWTSVKTGKTYSTFDSPYKNAAGEICKLAILHDVTDRKKLENDLRHQLYFTQTLLDAIPNPVFFKDAEGRYLGCNKEYEDFRGIAKEDLCGRTLTDIAMPKDVEALSAMDIRLLGGSGPQQFETSLLLKNNTRREVIYHKACFTSDAGEPAGLIGVIQDITTLKNAEHIIKNHNQELEQRVIDRTRSLEESNVALIASNRELELRRQEAETTQKKLQQLSSAVENSPATIVITDCFGRIEYVNPKFTEITGYLSEEAIGQNPNILSAGWQSKELYRELWDTIRAGLEWRGDFCNRKKNGDFYWEHASISPIRDELGNITHFVAIKEDVTEQKRIADELLAARYAADAANRSKSEFLANMSHEIRTPLNAIIGFSSLALKSSLPPRQHEYVLNIQTAGEVLLTIVGDILNFSGTEAGQLEMEQIPFRLDTVLAAMVGMVQQKALDKGLNLLVDTSPDVPSCLIGDPHRLGQIVANLLNNAVKFTEQGEVVLETALLTRNSDRVQLQFSVRDTGVGISSGQISQLFQPFTQADGSTTRRFGGTGLGLSISKQLVELMGGEIWCESNPEKGSCFCFTSWFGTDQANNMDQYLPFGSLDVGNEEAPFDFSGFCVLLVEDNETLQLLGFEILKETGVVVHLAVNGMEAVMMITGGSTTYDLVLMDIQMPVMDGYEAVGIIRSDSRFAALPIIAMTGYAMLEEQQKIMRAGMNAIITKPFGAQTMLRTMQRFLRKRESGVHLSEQLECTGSDETAIPHIAGLDITGALSRLDGDRKLYLRMLHTFFENRSNAVTDIKDALSAGDSKLALRHANTVRSIAGTMGAMELERLALVVKNAVVFDEPPACVWDACERLGDEMGRLVTDMGNHLTSAPRTGVDTLPVSVNMAVVTPILNKLLDYIKGRDGRAERYLDDFHNELAGLPEKDVGQIRIHLNNFNFTAAGDALLALTIKNGIMLSSGDTGDYHP